MAAKKNKVGKVGKQNRNAGSHPSYKKRKMSLAQILAKRKYDKNYSAKPKNVAKRGEDNKGRKKLGLKVGDKRDASRRVINGVVKWVKEHRSKNRGSKSNSPGDKRARGGGKKPKAPNYKKHFRKLNKR